MTTRREFIKITCGFGAGLFISTKFGFITQAFAAPIPGGSLDPGAISKFTTPLPIPAAMPMTGNQNTVGGRVDYYEIAVRQFSQQILPDGMPATRVMGYGSINHPGSFSSPGGTIEASWRKPVRVKWINDLVDSNGDYLPPLLPVDPTLHWANPPGGTAGRDMRPSPAEFAATPGPYTGPVPVVTHLHGGHSQDASDGYPTAWFLPNAANIPDGYARAGTQWDPFRAQFAKLKRVDWSYGHSIYQYENDQAATTLWYHDHALGMTRTNVYAGLAGFYLLRGGAGDSVRDSQTGLPAILPGPAPAQGDTGNITYREVPLVIQDRAFNADGSLFYPDTRAFFDGFEVPYVPDSDIAPIWNPEFFGNTMLVNGRTWPYLDVEPRRYRFRLLNGCGSRFVILRLGNGGTFWQIGGDGGFLPAPVQLTELLVAPAERVDFIIDFAGLPDGTKVLLENVGPDEPFGGGTPGVDFATADPATTGQVMEFRVGALVTADDTTPPERLVMPVLPPLGAVTNTRLLSLNELSSAVLVDPNNSAEMFGPRSAMLGTAAIDPASGTPIGIPMAFGDSISERIRMGSTEVWEIYNFTEDAHPIHVHQVQFEIVNREVFDIAVGVPGSKRLPEAGETGRKDVVIAYPGQITRIRAHFDITGLYVWHCHIIEHEDNEMMRPMMIY